MNENVEVSTPLIEDHKTTWYVCIRAEFFNAVAMRTITHYHSRSANAMEPQHHRLGESSHLWVLAMKSIASWLVGKCIWVEIGWRCPLENKWVTPGSLSCTKELSRSSDFKERELGHIQSSITNFSQLKSCSWFTFNHTMFNAHFFTSAH